VRLLSQDPTTGLLRLRLETPSDLWRIARLVKPGERVGASTTRRDPEAPADVAGAERARRRVFLVIRAEQIEFHGFSKHVRLTGPILEGPFDIGRHHTLDLTEGDEVAVTKAGLTVAERSILEEGLAHKGEPTILVAAVDWGDSSFVRLRGRAIEPVADVRRTIAGKRFEPGQGAKDRNAYREELRALVEREGADAQAVVVAGPGFLKEELARELAEKAPLIAKKLRVYPTAEAGRTGIDELLRSGRATEVLRGTVAAEEAEAVEHLVRALATGVRAAVGAREVAEAVEAGAAETVLVLEDRVPDPAIGVILEKLPSSRATLLVVRSEGESGARLAGLGGIGAVLRYDWTSERRLKGSLERPRGAPRTAGEGP
jgi:protein pelota